MDGWMDGRMDGWMNVLDCVWCTRENSLDCHIEHNVISPKSIHVDVILCLDAFSVVRRYEKPTHAIIVHCACALLTFAVGWKWKEVEARGKL